MMTQPRSELDDFQSLLDGFYTQLAAGDSLQRIRAKAWDHFQELGLPTRQNEVYRYIKLRNLYSQAYVEASVPEIAPNALEPYIYPECSQSVLVFVNGHFQPQLSRTKNIPKKAVIANLNDAVRTYSALLNNQWAKTVKDEIDAFAALNASLHRNGAFFYLPPKTIVEAPVQFLHVVAADDNKLIMMPRLQLFVGSQAQIDIVSTHAVISGDGYCINQVAEMALEEDSHVKYTQVNCHPTPNIWHFDALRAILKRDSTLKTVSITEGSLTIRNDYRVALTGENAEALLNGVWMLGEKREAHAHVVMDHQAPYCRSMQLFKGVLTDFSHSSFEGKILVRQAAQKTEAFQLNNNLLLSDRANAESKPNLEIFADDVKASHGATVGQLDKEELFYMKTRGFSDAEAKNLLIYGFCKEVINMITVPSILQEVSQRAQRYISRG